MLGQTTRGAETPLPCTGLFLPHIVPTRIDLGDHASGTGGYKIIPCRMTAIVLLGNPPSPPRAWSGRTGRYEIGPDIGPMDKG